jgi:glycine cleavage system regulatory protein
MSKRTATLGIMASIVLTVVGDDRAGIVHLLAETISAHGGNWERSELAELAGTFAGVVLVSVPADRLDELKAALGGIDALLSIAVRRTPEAAPATPSGVGMTFTVLGNDRPGIVRDVTNTLTEHGLTIDTFSSRTIEAPMSGGMLFDATIVVRAAGDDILAGAAAALERLAGEMQVDLSQARV